MAPGGRNCGKRVAVTMPSMDAPTFRTATREDAELVAGMVNAAMSGDGGTAGWTHEAHLMRGERTVPDEIATMIGVAGARFILPLLDGEAVGCVYVKPQDDWTYLAMLGVRPTRQASGL